MSRHPLNPSIDERMERDPKTVMIIDAIVNGRISPTIDLHNLADHPGLNVDDRYQALAYMRHACRIIVDREKFSLLLVTFDSPGLPWAGQSITGRNPGMNRGLRLFRKLQSDYVRQCRGHVIPKSSLSTSVAMPLNQYQAEHGMVADQYGVSLGSYPSDYLEGMQAALSLLLPDAA